MFVSDQLKNIDEFIDGQAISPKVIEQLNQNDINIEDQLLAAKALRPLQKTHQLYIAQADINAKKNNLAYLFAPFILANLNQQVIYSTPARTSALAIFKQYYNAEKLVKIDLNQAIDSLNVGVELLASDLNEADFFYLSLIKALCLAHVQTIILITPLSIKLTKLKQIEEFFAVKIHVIDTSANTEAIDLEKLSMAKLLFKNKAKEYVDLCAHFAELNTEILKLNHFYQPHLATQLIEDMFYSEHIYEKMSVYGEYIQTQIQNQKI